MFLLKSNVLFSGNQRQAFAVTKLKFMTSRSRFNRGKNISQFQKFPFWGQNIWAVHIIKKVAYSTQNMRMNSVYYFFRGLHYVIRAHGHPRETRRKWACVTKGIISLVQWTMRRGRKFSNYLLVFFSLWRLTSPLQADLRVPIALTWVLLT